MCYNFIILWAFVLTGYSFTEISGMESAMKKTWVIIVNVCITIAMLTFVVLYSNYENRETVRRQTEHFENTTITMEHITENYLEGEQRICDVWAR